MKAIYFLLIALLIVGCGPSAEQMTATADSARALTQTAAPTWTPTLTPTITPSPTLTPSPTPSATSTPETSKGGLPGESIADERLQLDALAYVILFESIGDCQGSNVVNTILVDSDASDGEWSERWIVDRCGTEGSYLITFTVDPAGGYFIGVSKEK